jgi:N-acetylneuraminic acid mutarotase
MEARGTAGVRRVGLVTTILALFLGAMPLGAESPQGPGRWLVKAPLPIARTEVSVAELDGKLYVVGGYVEGSVTSYLVDEYDPASDRWRSRRRLPLGLNHVGSVGHDGKLYAFGGFIRQNRDPVDNAFVYDPATDRWREIAPLPAKRGSISAVSLNGKIHVIGGAVGVHRGERRSVTTHEVYDPASESWSPRAPLPERRDHFGLVVVDGKIHAVGGRLESWRNNSALHHVYDTATDAWTPRAPLPTPRSGAAVGLLDGYIVAIGGEGEDGVFDQSEAYDPATDRWVSLAPMPTPRHGTGAAVIGEMLYIPAGGPVRGGSRRSNVHEAFTLR